MSALGTFRHGTGQGCSVMQVLAAVGKAAGAPVPYTVGPRRAGDPPSLVASPDRAKALLGWTPSHSSLDEIAADALRWERSPAYGTGLRRADGPRRARIGL